MKTLLRLFRINQVLMRYGLVEIVSATHLLRPIRFLIYLNPYYWWYIFSNQKHLSRGEKIRLTLEELGPIFVKFGQILSTRRDLLPDDIADQLVLLQDRVPPFSSEKAVSIIENALSTRIKDVFSEFDTTPFASASIAQVHAARLHGGEDVVVKVLRPHIEQIIRDDLGLLYTIAKLAEKHSKEARRLRPIDIVKEFEYSLLDELDLLREAGNASQLRRNFQGDAKLYVPAIYWDYCRTNMIVMERIYGIPISDIASLRAHHINLKQLAASGVEIFFTQVFRDCFFHADMHAGNIFVSPHNQESPQYIAVDFGIIGTLTPQDQHYLANNLLAFFHRDYKRVAELHVESGWVPATTRVEAFESAIRTVCEPIFEKPLKEISFGAMLLRLFQTARRFEMQIQPQLILLQKTLLNIEGLGRQLYPDLNLWQTAQPFLEKWVKEQMGIRALYHKIKQKGPTWISQLGDLPDQLVKINQRETALQTQQIELNLQQKSLKKIHRNLSGVSIVLVTLLLSNLLLLFLFVRWTSLM